MWTLTDIQRTVQSSTTFSFSTKKKKKKGKKKLHNLFCQASETFITEPERLGKEKNIIGQS